MRRGKLSCLGSLLLYMVQFTSSAFVGTQFASHVSVNTPARSFTHGVGDPVTLKRSYPQRATYRSFRRPIVAESQGGYPRFRPTIPFNHEDSGHRTTLGGSKWQYNSFMDVPFPVLPISPYKVDSPDPESLWPDGLFLPPINAPRFRNTLARIDTDDNLSVDDPSNPDPYLLEGSEAIAAVARANRHGELYFHDIPHIESLLANQELRKKNKLKPHRLGSIRHTWPYNRP